jgi:rod shape-determining protein MreC
MFSLKRKKKLNQIKFIACLVLGFSLILYQQFYPKSADSLRLYFYAQAAPITNITKKPAQIVENSIKNLSYYFNAISENKELKLQNAKLESVYKHALKIIAENQDLRYLANMSEYLEYETVSAEVYFDSSNLYANSLMVKLGKKDGIKPGFAVLTAEGLIGRVLETNDHFSRILLIDDFNASIPVRILETGVQGIIQGQNNYSYVSLITKEIGDTVKVGQHVVSSSVQGLFDDGIPVGIVSEVNDEIKIVPYANLNRIHKVLIVKRLEQNGEF